MEEIIYFYGAEFERIVREELKIPDGPILLSHALNIKSLNFSECDFLPADFETLYRFKNLEELIFEKNEGIIDFNVFTPLKKLRYLIVGGSIFSNVTFANLAALKELPYLEYLSVADFGNIDIAEIGKVQQLKELCIGWGTSVANAEAIKELKQLNSLELYDIKIKNLNFFNDLSCEVQLDLGGLEIEEEFDIALLNRFKKCEWELLSVNGSFI